MAQNASLNDSLPTPPKPRKHTWISLWFLFAMPIMLWDAGFCFMRPRSMVGGDLHFLWAPYTLQQEVDLLYSAKTYEEGGGFTNAQALMNLVETALSFVYLLGKSGILQGRFKKVAELLGFLSAGMTFGKTVLYWAQEYFCNWCTVGHNDLRTLVSYWAIPQGLWTIFPALIVLTLGRDLVEQLEYAEAKATEARNK